MTENDSPRWLEWAREIQARRQMEAQLARVQEAHSLALREAQEHQFALQLAVEEARRGQEQVSQEHQHATHLEEGEALAAQMQGVALKLTAAASEEGRLFGSVTASAAAAAAPAVAAPWLSEAIPTATTPMLLAIATDIFSAVWLANACPISCPMTWASSSSVGSIFWIKPV